MSSKLRVPSVENDRSFHGRVVKQRQRFTPWLVEQIEPGDIDGLEWIDKNQGKPESQLETDAELFKRWEKYTGKYRPGNQPDHGNLEGNKPHRVLNSKFEPKPKGVQVQERRKRKDWKVQALWG